MDQVHQIGMDTSKHIFQIHGVNAAEIPILRKKLRRGDMATYFEKLAWTSPPRLDCRTTIRSAPPG